MQQEKKSSRQSRFRRRKIMFNFIFDGKIGEILAPVKPNNQLFLSIQHHRNQEVPNLMTLLGNDINLIDGVCAAIHVCCRYNNKLALDLILSRGSYNHFYV